MAQYKSGSRFLGGKKGKTIDGTEIVFPRVVDEISIATIVTISAKQEYRHDLISLQYYRRPDLGWFIMIANKFDHVSQLKAGVTINIPSIVGFIR